MYKQSTNKQDRNLTIKMRRAPKPLIVLSSYHPHLQLPRSPYPWGFLEVSCYKIPAMASLVVSARPLEFGPAAPAKEHLFSLFLLLLKTNVLQIQPNNNNGRDSKDHFKFYTACSSTKVSSFFVKAETTSLFSFRPSILKIFPSDEFPTLANNSTFQDLFAFIKALPDY